MYICNERKIKALNERYKEEFKQKARETGHRLTKVCPYCQKEFEYIRSQELSYCSKKCAYAAAKKIKHCIRCGKIITQRGRKYCDDCIKIRRKELREDSKIRIKTECGYCYKELEVIPAKLKVENMYIAIRTVWQLIILKFILVKIHQHEKGVKENIQEDDYILETKLVYVTIIPVKFVV